MIFPPGKYGNTVQIKYSIISPDEKHQTRSVYLLNTQMKTLVHCPGMGNKSIRGLVATMEQLN
jgi:hypothetical protein